MGYFLTKKDPLHLSCIVFLFTNQCQSNGVFWDTTLKNVTLWNGCETLWKMSNCESHPARLSHFTLDMKESSVCLGTFQRGPEVAFLSSFLVGSSSVLASLYIMTYKPLPSWPSRSPIWLLKHETGVLRRCEVGGQGWLQVVSLKTCRSNRGKGHLICSNIL